MTENETEKLLCDTKILLGLETQENDEVLELIIEDTINAVLSYCRLDFLPRQLYSLIPRMCASLWRENGYAPRDILSIEEGDRKIVYSEPKSAAVIENYTARLKPFVRRNAKLPSEVKSE